MTRARSAAAFFGRQELVRRLRDRVESRPSTHLTVLAGPSGTGKSSVVRAGLIPALRDSDIPVGVMLPGEDPFAALRNTLGEVTGEPPGQLMQILDEGGAVGPVVVIVDQFEELFTLVTIEESANRFLDLMASATAGVSLYGGYWLGNVTAGLGIESLVPNVAQSGLTLSFLVGLVLAWRELDPRG